MFRLDKGVYGDGKNWFRSDRKYVKVFHDHYLLPMLIGEHPWSPVGGSSQIQVDVDFNIYFSHILVVRTVGEFECLGQSSTKGSTLVSVHPIELKLVLFQRISMATHVSEDWNFEKCDTAFCYFFDSLLNLG